VLTEVHHIACPSTTPIMNSQQHDPNSMIPDNSDKDLPPVMTSSLAPNVDPSDSGSATQEGQTTAAEGRQTIDVTPGREKSTVAESTGEWSWNRMILSIVCSLGALVIAM